ncbi:MAG: hypothetical protein PHX87_01110 [Candidatus Peribacteraceae bacterium]|nr:hypothetical protein [Candidatus Peribacteraceae bacterium]MDD5742008.1 hypothetical protein [Candidatus Peribacteraceae bacterium]
MPDGLHGLGRLECAANISLIESGDLPPKARGRKGISREVVGESDPRSDPALQALVQDYRDEELQAGAVE